jgi:hypothetical protein
MAYAKGKYAYGRCMRSGKRIPYSQLVEDGDKPGLLVAPDERDIRHPAKTPPRIVEGIALRQPSPDIDNDSPSGSGDQLVDAFSFDSYFGGGT